jgi:hypothetical protein
MTTPEVTEEPVAVPAVRGSLHEPWRALVALAELLVAGGAIWLAFWCWSHSAVTVTTVLGDGTRLDSTDYVGHWQAAAIALGTVAAALVLDEVRQIVLAVRVRPRRAKSKHAALSRPANGSDE